MSKSIQLMTKKVTDAIGFADFLKNFSKLDEEKRSLTIGLLKEYAPSKNEIQMLKGSIHFYEGLVALHLDDKPKPHTSGFYGFGSKNPKEPEPDQKIKTMGLGARRIDKE